MDSPPGNDSDIENFTKNILQRAQLRRQILEPNAKMINPEFGADPKAPTAEPSILKITEEEEESEEEEDYDESLEEEDKPHPDHGKPTSSVPISAQLSAKSPSEFEQDKPRPNRTSRLTALANTINGWEDDLTRTFVSSRFKSPEKVRLSTGGTKPGASPVRDNFGVKISLREKEKDRVLDKLEVSKLEHVKQKEPSKVTKLEHVKQNEPSKVTKLEHVKQNEPSKVTKLDQSNLDEPSNEVPKLELARGYVRGRPSCAVPPGTVRNQMRLFESEKSGLFSIPKGAVQGKRGIFERSTLKSKPEERARSASPERGLPKFVFGQEVVYEAKTDESMLQPQTVHSRCKAIEESTPATLIPMPPPPPIPISPSPRSRPIPMTPSPRSRSLSPAKTVNPKRTPKSAQHKRAASPSPAGSPTYPGLSEVKKIRVTSPKQGKIYPSLTDIECSTEDDVEMYNDEDMDLDSETSAHSAVSGKSGASLGTRIERIAKSSPVQTPRNSRYRPTEDFSNSLAIQQIDALIDDALEGQDYTLDTVLESQLKACASSTPNTQSLSDSESTLCKTKVNNPGLLETDLDTVLNDSACGPKVVGVTDSDPMSTSSPLVFEAAKPDIQTPLLHTVSFYRRQQTPMKCETPKRVIQLHSQQILKPDPGLDDQVKTVNQAVAKLEEEVSQQQRTIAQVSKALNLCKATLEFAESSENVECERVLLIATQKRLSILNEIHRLRTQAVLQPKSIPTCHGNITITNLTIPLRPTSNPEKIRHFICVVKYRDQVEASELVSISRGNEIRFSNTFKIGRLEPEFGVNLEVYSLETEREFLPHEAKYHIKKADSKKSTPRKNTNPTLSRPFQSSPAGPDAVRTSNFDLISSVRIVIGTLKRSRWALIGPCTGLEGHAFLDIKCSSESDLVQSGFLTLFDDIAGYGAWKRRWVRLGDGRLDYWMYPDDESKTPLGSIQLNTCITPKVGPASREICARANTFLLVTARDPEPGDKETLTMSCHRDYTAVRHLITADTKEERDVWCKEINTSLANVRAWDPNATRVSV